MTSDKYEGGCLCGAIRYRSAAPPMRCVICHCGDCRKHSGAPCLSFVHFPKHSFTWVLREPQRYRSSQYAERGFCPECGSTLSMHEVILEDRVQVTLGSLDSPEQVMPQDTVNRFNTRITRLYKQGAESQTSPIINTLFISNWIYFGQNLTWPMGFSVPRKLVYLETLS